MKVGCWDVGSGVIGKRDGVKQSAASSSIHTLNGNKECICREAPDLEVTLLQAILGREIRPKNCSDSGKSSTKRAAVLFTAAL